MSADNAAPIFTKDLEAIFDKRRQQDNSVRLSNCGAVVKSHGDSLDNWLVATALARVGRHAYCVALVADGVQLREYVALRTEVRGLRVPSLRLQVCAS